ncbi:MAG: KEOPS complex subunit Pcc1 [Haloarculaceae archaeon]
MSDEYAGGDAAGSPEARRRATVTTAHADAATAERVAAALSPDNTAEMATRTEGSRVVTTIARESTGGLASTLDDYVVNATVAARLTTDDARHSDATDTRDTPTS